MITGARRRLNKKTSNRATSFGLPTITLTLAAVKTATRRFWDQGKSKARPSPKATDQKIAGKMVPPLQPKPKPKLVKRHLPKAKLIKKTGPSLPAWATRSHMVKAPDQSR